MTSGTPNHENRLYRYLRTEYAIQAIETGLLKVGRLAELNDPFEFTPAIAGLREDVPSQTIDKLENLPIELLNESVGILCFCKVILDPAVWTHYGNDHTGVALGFDYPSLEKQVESRDVTKVSYPDSDLRPVINFTVWSHLPYEEKDKVAIASLGRKARSWQYEREYRIFVPLSRCIAKNGMYWHPIPKNLLVEVILGIRCPVADDRFRQALKDGGFSLAEVRRAKRSRTRYEVEIS